MLFTPETYFLIEDIANRQRNLVVVMESDQRSDLEVYRQSASFAGCEIYKEQGDELYRLICERRVTPVVTGRSL